MATAPKAGSKAKSGRNTKRVTSRRPASSKKTTAKKTTAKKTTAKKTTARRPAARKRASSGTPRWLIATLRVLAVLAALGALVLFSLWAYRLTLTPVHDHGQAIGNTHPGRTLRFYLDRPSIREAVTQIGGNLALLAPLGILLPVVVTRLRGVVRTTVAGAVISLMIETSQGLLIDGRAFDADDVILNTAGVAITYLLVGRHVVRLVRGRA